MSIIAGIGFLIKYTLVPGRESQIKYGNNVELSLFGLDRHEWGNIHLLISLVFLGLLALHLILHWKVIVSVFNRLIQRKKLKRTIALTFITLTALLIITPFLIRPEIDKVENKNGQQRTNRYDNAKRIKTNEEVAIPISSKVPRVAEKYKNTTEGSKS